MAVYGGPEIATSGLVLCLDAGNTKSYPGTGTSWNDLSGNGNNGTLTNGPSYNSARNGTILLDGTNDYIVKDSLASFNVYCISIWVRPAYLINSTSASSSLIQLRYQAAAGNYAWYVAFGSTTLLLTDEYITIANVQDGGRIAITDGGSLLANTWYNLVFNYESTAYKFYINGINKATTAGSTNVSLLTNPNKLYIGALDGDGSSVRSFFNGTIGQVSLYNRALSASEILNNYNALKGRYASYLTDPDAITYVAAVEAADGQELERSVALAYQSFIVGCKADNIWNVIKCSCILMGARTLSGALVPLVGPAPTNNNFVSNDYYRKTGIQGTSYNTTKLILTNYLDSDLPQNSAHISAYMSVANSLPSQQIIASVPVDPNKDTRIIGNTTSTVFLAARITAGARAVVLNSSTGLLCANRSSSNLLTGYVSGTTGTNTVSSSTVPSGNSFRLFGGTDGRVAFFSIGESIDIAKLDTRVSALYTAIGAAIP